MHVSVEKEQVKKDLDKKSKLSGPNKTHLKMLKQVVKTIFKLLVIIFRD